MELKKIIITITMQHTPHNMCIHIYCLMTFEIAKAQQLIDWRVKDKISAKHLNRLNDVSSVRAVYHVYMCIKTLGTALLSI